jgi:hypothetical protein
MGCPKELAQSDTAKFKRLGSKMSRHFADAMKKLKFDP